MACVRKNLQKVDVVVGRQKAITNNGPSHVSGNFLPFKGKSHSLSSQAARFFSLAKGEKSLL
jgi:hypothetical protein